ncbi:hypothetical protein BK673_23920 [Pseudomonas fluorescens]|uniref:Uncharacterized protein n=1 Tax=Pseudomonas fluorescens TaxID=294 RepID=A0A423NZA0_PSEFL|nr:hypothetical protein BOW65_19270 [Pseudomonas koreensis]ROO03730.1 hypothetical protein BK673_23920 [Pseudomonas fluorescens]TKJ80156.1 hypothetical protein PkoCFBP13504_20230 [Pseudomonas koreensis]
MANVLHALVAFTTIADWIHCVIYTHQLRHRECFRITDDRPFARIAADRESIMVLGKTRFGGFFFVHGKVYPFVGAAAGCDLLIWF